MATRTAGTMGCRVSSTKPCSCLTAMTTPVVSSHSPKSVSLGGEVPRARPQRLTRLPPKGRSGCAFSGLDERFTGMPPLKAGARWEAMERSLTPRRPLPPDRGVKPSLAAAQAILEGQPGELETWLAAPFLVVNGVGPRGPRRLPRPRPGRSQASGVPSAQCPPPGVLPGRNAAEFLQRGLPGAGQPGPENGSKALLRVSVLAQAMHHSRTRKHRRS